MGPEATTDVGIYWIFVDVTEYTFHSFLSTFMSPFRIIGIAGSLRKGSTNMGLLKAIEALADEKISFSIFPIGDIPVFNQDQELSLPPAVKALKEAVKAADAIVFSTPEYNYSIPGVLKNTIDWLSRPSGQNSLREKPVAIIGTSSGMLGSSRAQYHLRQVLFGLDARTLSRPEIIVGGSGEKFTADGVLTDPKTKEKLQEMLDALVSWTKRLRL